MDMKRIIHIFRIIALKLTGYIKAIFLKYISNKGNFEQNFINLPWNWIKRYCAWKSQDCLNIFFLWIKTTPLKAVETIFVGFSNTFIILPKMFSSVYIDEYIQYNII